MQEDQHNATVSDLLFYKNPVPISMKHHAHWGLSRAEPGYTFSANAHVIPVTLLELPLAAVCYPLVFVGAEKKSLAAVMSFESGTNLMVGSTGEWMANMHIPEYVRRYPFVLGKNKNGDEDESFLCFDADSELIESKEPDLPFFDNNEVSEFSKSVFARCEAYEHSRLMTEKAVKMLGEYDLLGLLKTKSITVDGQDGTVEFIGIDETRFAELSDKDVLELRTNGLLNIIYAQLISMANWKHLRNIVRTKYW